MKVFKPIIVLTGLFFILLDVDVMAVYNPFKDLKGLSLGNAYLDIGGNVRLRYEYQNNYNIKKYTDTKDNYLLERIRLNIGLKTQKGLKAFIQFQDSHCIDCALTTNDFKGKSPYVNELDLRQAYLEWHKINGSPFGFKVGRQQIAYRDKRVFGPGSWGNVGRYTWDAFVLKYENDFLNIDTFFAKRIFYLPETFLDKHYPFEVYALYGKIRNLPFILDFFYVFKRNHSDIVDEFGNSFPAERRQTFGLYCKGKIPLPYGNIYLNYSGLYAYQIGSYPSKDKCISAYGYYANIGLNYRIYIPQAFWLKYSYGSGDKDPNDNKIQTFDGIFGGIAEYFGRMNLFCWKNIKDYQLTYQLEPVKELKVTLDYHWFYLAQKTDYWYYCNGKPVQNRTPPFPSAYLGNEADLFLKYNLNRDFQFQFGCCRFFPRKAIVESGFHEKADYVIWQALVRF